MWYRVDNEEWVLLKRRLQNTIIEWTLSSWIIRLYVSAAEQRKGANEEKKRHTLDKRHEDGVVASQSVRPAFCGRPKWLRVNPLRDFLLHHSIKIQQLLI